MTAPESIDPAESTETELVQRCLGGDPDAWNGLFDAHYDAAGRFVYQLGPNLSREDVEEICQETFLAVVRSLGGFQGGSRLQTWIFRIAGNKARDYRERRAAAKRGGGRTPVSLQAEDPETGLSLDPPSERPGPDEGLARQEEHQGVRMALDQLGDPCREIIELRYFGDLSYEEIGASLRLNLKTVSSRLSKCLDKLETLVREVAAREGSTPFSVS